MSMNTTEYSIKISSTHFKVTQLRLNRTKCDIRTKTKMNFRTAEHQDECDCLRLAQRSEYRSSTIIRRNIK